GAFIDVKGTLYGTTPYGGSGSCNDHGSGSGCGTVFSVTTAGKETVVYNFKGAPGDGSNPLGGLLNVNGTLYGTTQLGGTNGKGTVFAVTPSGKETVFYSFKGGSGDGSYPLADLANVNGTLYGTTISGGVLCKRYSGCGTVFSVTTAGTETVLHRFKGWRGGDGAWPYAGLLNVNGTLYGTTYLGGRNNGGTVFSLTP
ncbi:MAG: choice-of-anchor tandem repeat GloVer-containing protein, partial [Candidatus Cybelea sp.]